MDRKEMMKNLTNKKGLLNDLNDTDFQRIYDTIWTLTAKDLLYKCAKQDLENIKKTKTVFLEGKLMKVVDYDF